MDKYIIPSSYSTPLRHVSWFSRRFPALAFYLRLSGVIIESSRLAKKGAYSDEDWVKSSRATIDLLEMVGVSVEMENVSAISGLDSPCVFVGNHMSVLETFVLPCIIQPHNKFTFVVKESLINYPVFKHIMKSRDPIVVGRVNPREDFKKVLEGGLKRLNQGISVLIFPQTTRTTQLDPKAFNSIGIKLAKKAGVPVIPFALKTDAWGIGRWIKDFGKIDPSKRVRFWFGNPITVSGRGKDEHEAVLQFIMEKLKNSKG
jgi:1-acyl-sn-glycerol-3-phosphate acyltransferase